MLILSAYNNSISTIQPGAFDSMTQLEQVFLYGNRLTSLPAGLFDRTTQLKYLRLDQNAITFLPDGLLSNCRFLTDLVLHSNQISQLPSNLLSPESAPQQLFGYSILAALNYRFQGPRQEQFDDHRWCYVWQYEQVACLVSQSKQNLINLN